MSGEVTAPLEVQRHESVSPFTPIDHDVPVASQVMSDDIDMTSEPEPVAQLPGETPLAEMTVDVVGIVCRFLDPENELTALERDNLKSASAALERRYAPWLENKADAIIWSRFAITIGMVATPRVKAWRERTKAEQDATSDRDSDRASGIGQDLAPGQAPE